MESAIASGDLVIQGGDYEQGYTDLLELLGIDENEIEDEDATSIKLQLSITSGDLYNYLVNNAAYGQQIDNVDEILEGYFQYLGIEDVNLEDLDASTKAAIYNTEMDVEELGCQAAMKDQFGEEEAAAQGYITASENAATTAANTTMEYVRMNSGAIAGIVIAALVAVIGFVLIAFKKGKNKGKSEAEASHGYHLDEDGEAV